ncbi:MAG: hypothetical protein WD604_02520 [Balneolaceae bacterium]
MKKSTPVKKVLNRYNPVQSKSNSETVKETLNRYNPVHKKSSRSVKEVVDRFNPFKKRKKGIRGITEKVKTVNKEKNGYLKGGILFLAVTGAIYAVIWNQRKKQIYQKKYDPGTVFKFQGKIIDVVNESNGSKEAEGVELILQTSESILPVHLGPAWYLDHQQVKFKKGEKVHITGSMNLSGRDASVVASKVQLGNKRLNLRDDNGHPYWYAWN